MITNQKQWNKLEAVILLDNYLKYVSGSLSRKEAIELTSVELRKLAQNQHIEIDDIFRNVNGITFQMCSIESAYRGYTVVKPASKLFIKIANLYKNDIVQYNVLLKEARNMISSLPLTKDDFYTWLLAEKGLANATCLSYSSAVKTAEEFAQANISTDCELFSDDVENIKKTIHALMQHSEFCIKNDDQHNRYFAALRKYLEFVQSDSSANIVINKSAFTVNVVEKKEIEDTLITHYQYGFNISSPIEIMRFKNYYKSDHGTDRNLDDALIISTVKSIGFDFEGKVYVIPQSTFGKIKCIIDETIHAGGMIIYYEEFFNQNEQWLCESHILSANMLRNVIEEMSQYQCKYSYFLLTKQKSNELDAVKLELERVWGDYILQNLRELHEKLPYVPIDKIKYALSYGKNFFWNSFETYANIKFFKITDSQIQLLKSTASTLCDEKGSFLFEDLHITDIVSENFELSETAFHDIIFNYLSKEFSRNSKVISRKGESVDATTGIIQYCRTRKSCSMSELEAVMKEKSGELRYPIVIEAGNIAMVRIELDKFVADDLVQFDIDKIDTILEDIIQDEFIGLKEINTFNAFPFCGYAWNSYLLESFCRRFSKKFKYECITPNSKNAGAIIKKSCQLTYHEIMAKAIAQSVADLNENAVFEFLVSAGYMIRRQYSNIKDLLEQAASLRERRY